MESEPVRIILVLIIVAMTISLCLYQLNSFLNFKTRSDFLNSAKEIAEQISFLKNTGSVHSVETVVIDIPEGYSLDVNESSVIAYTDKEYSFDVPGKIVNSSDFPLNQGSYEIRLSYGGELKNYTVVFS